MAKEKTRRDPNPTAAELAAVSADDLWWWLYANFNDRWSDEGMDWICGMPLTEALPLLAMAYRCSPREVIDRVVSYRRDRDERRRKEHG